MERDDSNHKPATPIPSVDSALESWGSSGLENYNQNSTSQAIVVAETKNGTNKHNRDKSGKTRDILFKKIISSAFL